MEQMLTYIFNGLQKCDENFLAISKLFNKQNKLNRLTSISLMISAYTTYKAVSISMENRAKIKALTKEIEKLKEQQQEPVESGE